jgi:hypothetical protein
MAKEEQDVSTLDRILQLAEATEAQLEALSQRVSAIEGKQPKFVPMEKPARSNRVGTYRPPEQLDEVRARGMKTLTEPGQSAGGRRNILEIDVNRLPPEYRPVFRQGDLVRINPDAKIHRSETEAEPEGRTWGQVLEKFNSDGIGEVKALMYISKTYEPKYRVRVPGVTPQTGDGFMEAELLPYDY